MRGFLFFPLEKKLIQLIFVLMVIMIAVQYSFQYGEIPPPFYPLALLEPYLKGEVEVLAPVKESYLLILLKNRSKEPRAKILVDGIEVASFRENPLFLKVKEGDEISLDIRGVESLLWFQILETSQGIISFGAGEEYLLKPKLYYLGPIRKEYSP